MNRMKRLIIAMGLSMGLLGSGCVKEEVMSNTFDKPEVSAKRLKNGRYAAVIPVCHQYVDGRKTDYHIENYIWGCATARNLGMMIDDAKDFEKPQRTYTYPGAPLARAVEDFQFYDGRGARSAGGAQASAR